MARGNQGRLSSGREPESRDGNNPRPTKKRRSDHLRSWLPATVSRPPTRDRGPALAPLAGLLLAFFPLSANALSDLEQIPLPVFEKMREVERYQLKIAEKYYTSKNYKVALAEYEKFLTLYEKSPGAPYAQLMWSHTQIHLKKVKTALREGFQSVIDYWPESHSANVAAYCIGDAYRKMGEVKKAKNAFHFVLKEYPDTPLSLRSSLDLLHYARLHQNGDGILEILKGLTYVMKRTEWSTSACVQACQELATMYFFAQDFTAGRKALATSYKDEKLIQVVFDMTVKTMNHLLKEDKTRRAAFKLGDQLIAQVRRDSIEDSQNARSHLYRIAGLHGMLGRPNKIWAIYEEVEEKFGRNDDLRGRMAQWHLSRENIKNARRLYEEYDNRVAGLEALATMLQSVKQPAEAIKVLHQLIALNSDNEVGYLETIAQIYQGMSKFNEAIGVFVKLIDLNGENAPGYQWSIGGCYESMSEWKKAIGMYRQINDFPKTHFAMAICHRRIGEHKEAVALYRQCLVNDASAPRATLEIAYTYEEAKEAKNAIRTFQLTCRRYPKSKQAARAHAHLQNKYNINVTLGGAEDE